MCGIAGIISTNNFLKSKITQMLQSMNHRGPDETGTLMMDNFVFGHNRLSILDIDNGSQPMKSNCRKFSITFNGEIYNYKNLRNKLTYECRTRSDTEVILALYIKYGKNMFSHIQGMFAFGIYDDINNSFILARDRFGQKPLFYSRTRDGELIFASEIKGILSTGLVSKEIRYDALTDYLENLYIAPNKTIYRHIHSLPPGHYLEFKNKQIFIKKYFELPITENISENDAIEIFKSSLESAVKSHLNADVEVGAFLSGGVDSSTIVALASKYHNKLKTFSFDMGGEKSELFYAQQISKKYSTEHYIESINEKELPDLILKMSKVFDEPFGDSSAIPTYLISKLASKHVKVVLSGDGADELLGGYEWWYSHLAKFNLKDFWAKGIGKNEINLFLKKFIALTRYRSYLNAHINKPGFFSKQSIAKIINNNPKHLIESNFVIENSPNDVLKRDLTYYMPGDILVKIDRASMANSLEIRSPFLDDNFASFCISLPFDLKLQHQESKMILRKAYSSLLTSKINNRSKQGFGGPISNWFQIKNMKDFKKSYLDKDRRIFDFLSYKNTSEFINRNNYQTWALLILSIWFEENL